MNNLMKYKEYLGSVNYNDEDEILYGKVEYIRSLISYEGQDLESIRASFHEAVDDYLELFDTHRPIRTGILTTTSRLAQPDRNQEE